jgi:hypothetical protein
VASVTNEYINLRIFLARSEVVSLSRLMVSLPGQTGVILGNTCRGILLKKSHRIGFSTRGT